MSGWGSRAALEARIARLLRVGTNASVALIAVGVLLMAVAGRSPRDVAPGLDPWRLPGDLVRLQPSGFVWLGVLVVLATPLVRVAAATVGFVRSGEREMALVAALILVVIALGVVIGNGRG